MHRIDELETVATIAGACMLALVLIVLLVSMTTAPARLGPYGAVGAQNQKRGLDGTIHPGAGGSWPRPHAGEPFGKEPMDLKSGTPMDAAAVVPFFCGEGVCVLLESDLDVIGAALGYAAKKCAGRSI